MTVRDALEISAAGASERLARMAEACEGFYVVIAFLAYLGAALLIFFGVRNDFSVVPGVGLAIGITVSLLPVLLFCRWAQAYAADLAMRSADEAPRPSVERGEPGGPTSMPSEPVGLYGRKS